MLKCSRGELISSYEKLGNVWKVAEEFGMCGQSVWERLKKYGINTSKNILTDEDKKQIKEFYEEGFRKGDGKLREFSKKIKRTVPSISRYAKKIGISDIKRKECESRTAEKVLILKMYQKKYGHPRGMLGKTHTKENFEKIWAGGRKFRESLTDLQKSEIAEKAVATRRKNGSDCHSRGSWKAAWRTIGGHKKFFRSRWEANYARYLQLLKEKGEIKEWFHEPETFWFLEILRGTRSYLPDFKIIKNDGTHYWCEVKGWMCPRSITCIKRFRKYYPEEILNIIDASWFKENFKEISPQIKDWEFGSKF